MIVSLVCFFATWPVLMTPFFKHVQRNQNRLVYFDGGEDKFVMLKINPKLYAFWEVWIFQQAGVIFLNFDDWPTAYTT